jgi:mRNA interferase RelE/StbE
MQNTETLKFRKQLSKLPKNDQISVLDALETLEDAETFADISNMKALQGYKNYFRLRVGNWRIGLFWDGDMFQIQDVGKRGDFYKRFP